MAPSLSPLARALETLTREGELYERLPEAAVRCVACGHRCFIPEGRPGICKVRFNEAGRLMVPWGYVAALQCDPIEKKPFFHALPGVQALSFGMLGCDYHCAYCQNWVTSQAIRDPAAVAGVERTAPEDLVDQARARGAAVIASTYNEPLITSEWAAAVFRVAHSAGLLCAYISNGNGTPEVLDYLSEHLSFYKVDLKSFRDRNYRALGGRLQPVLDTITRLVRRGIWVEVVTLVVPGWNDSDEELRDIARFLGSVSPDIPWHLTAFHKDYKMTDPDDTQPPSLVRAAAIGREEGLRFVYAGNLPGMVGDLENTRCPGCGALLVGRSGYRILSYRVTGAGACPECGRPIPGTWRGGARHAQESGPAAQAEARRSDPTAGPPGGEPGAPPA